MKKSTFEKLGVTDSSLNSTDKLSDTIENSPALQKSMEIKEGFRFKERKHLIGEGGYISHHRQFIY